MQITANALCVFKGETIIERVIYGDVLMVINFSMDFLALYITAKIMHVKLINYKITISAAIGALYSLFILGFNINDSLTMILSLILSFVLTITAYGKQNIKSLIKNTAVFYLVNFSLGGGITAICNLLNVWQSKRNIMINGTYDVLYGDLPFGLLVLIGLFCGIFSLVSGKIVKRKTAEKISELKVTLNKTQITFEALVDSGNLLKEPISGKPVIVATFESVRKIIPVELFGLFKNKDTAVIEKSPYSSRIRLIPASTVNSKGLLFAFLPDSIALDNVEIDAYLAITNDIDSFGGYPAIVPNEITQ
ncbi:MAG: hypothetical protein E7574_04575 [Ruminococcaceae bacterium]|nr:hypothetical protein [Oscillospiraceae bacterium]